MDTKERKAHWEKVFQTKDTSKVSWYQAVPETSLRLINELNLPKSAKIIEVGAGDSFLGDCLLEQGYKDISLLDISEKALKVIKKRIEEKKENITFINQDITTFSGKNNYRLWHDRAVFHFLTSARDVANYVKNASDQIIAGGYLIISTFSDKGPNICSDLKVQQYSEIELIKCFKENFNQIKCFKEVHTTPSGSSQIFTFGVFQRK